MRVLKNFNFKKRQISSVAVISSVPHSAPSERILIPFLFALLQARAFFYVSTGLLLYLHYICKTTFTTPSGSWSIFTCSLFVTEPLGWSPLPQNTKLDFVNQTYFTSSRYSQQISNVQISIKPTLAEIKETYTANKLASRQYARFSFTNYISQIIF